MKVSGDLVFKTVIGVMLAAGLYYVLTKAAKTGASVATTVGKAINPANPDNVVNQGVSAVGAAITGNPDFSLGSWIYDITHSDPVVTTVTPIDYQSAPLDPYNEAFDPMGNRIY